MISVAYHNGQPAINVKLHVAGDVFWPETFNALDVTNDGVQEIGRTTAADLIDAAYNITQSYFWDVATGIAAPVLGPIYTDGRSGGWLVIDNDPTDGGNDDAPPEWLGEYQALAAWTRGFLSAAPEAVRNLALQLAMDELGREPARRMFAFDRENN